MSLSQLVRPHCWLVPLPTHATTQTPALKSSKNAQRWLQVLPSLPSLRFFSADKSPRSNTLGNGKRKGRRILDPQSLLPEPHHLGHLHVSAPCVLLYGTCHDITCFRKTKRWKISTAGLSAPERCWTFSQEQYFKSGVSDQDIPLWGVQTISDSGCSPHSPIIVLQQQSICIYIFFILWVHLEW